MSSQLRFDDRVVIITGAGNGLGRSYALLFASRGAKVVVNDLGGSHTGGGRGSEAADRVVAEITSAGGQAVPSYDSVEDGAKIVQTAIDAFGRLDIVVNNAGILRDVSFAKMTAEDWDLIYRVHVLGAFRVTQAAWPHLRDQGYGRVILTASAAGIYGNFGQANYSMAKLGLVGLGRTLALEGDKRNVHVNTIAPIAGSRMTETVLPTELLDALKPEYVSPLVAYLCHDSCEHNGGLFEVGGGFFGKLRWERAAGHMVRVGRDVTPEDVRRAWPAIVSFERSTHPQTVADSIQPIMGNAQAGASKGGNELIDVDLALGYEFPEAKTRYDERDAALYALGVGAAAEPVDGKDLQLVYEAHGDGFKVLPTYGVIPALNLILDQAKKGIKAPGLNYGFDRILHGEQYTEVARPLPSKAELTHRVKIKDIFDKGKNALVVIDVRSFDEDGDILVHNEITMVVRGAGGWGGDRGSSTEVALPDRKPDATREERIPVNQALLYRLSGDWNPLHADPAFAKAFGFEKPILHGLCVFGYAARHVIDAFCAGDPRLFQSIRVRFAESVFPGETVLTEMWRESKTCIAFQCKVKERDKVIVSRATVELFEEVPKKEPKAQAQREPGKAAAVSAEPICADVFAGIAAYLSSNPELAGRIGTIYQFKLTSPDSVWTLDLKNGKGACGPGETQKPECTLELADQDFMEMCTGKADAQKLYFGGKLKIGGNIMASQKLQFLQKIDPAPILAAAKARAGGGGGAAAAAPASGERTSADGFVAIRDWLSRHPETVGKVGTVYQFKLTGPDSVWTLDLKNGKGAVDPGETQKPDCTLTLSDEDFRAMIAGKADAQKLYFGGQLKIGGNIMASQKLQFLTTLDPKEAAAAIAAARQAGAPTSAAAAPAEKVAPQASAVFEKLGARLASRPDLVEQVMAVLRFKVEDKEWTVDLKTGKGAVKPGASGAADTTLTLDDATLTALVRGEHTAQDLHQRGQLRIEGDIRPARKLAFLEGLV
jgi:(3R)-3-hydroxyacyl-CoA dehydrogenase / 3a,7a,12a-trihydroxy-5b-cholest-24-enoyl-CoA hydratase / enoyl-CoA hydratase 2